MIAGGQLAKAEDAQSLLAQQSNDNKTEVYAPQPKVVVEAEICNVLLGNMLGMKKILFQHCVVVCCVFIINYDTCRPPDSV